MTTRRGTQPCTYLNPTPRRSIYSPCTCRVPEGLPLPCPVGTQLGSLRPVSASIPCAVFPKVLRRPRHRPYSFVYYHRIPRRFLWAYVGVPASLFPYLSEKAGQALRSPRNAVSLSLRKGWALEHPRPAVFPVAAWGLYICGALRSQQRINLLYLWGCLLLAT